MKKPDLRRWQLGFSVPPRGIETAAESAGKTAIPQAGGTESGTDQAEKLLETVLGCDRLRETAELWPGLSADQRASVLAEVQATAADVATDRG